MVHLTTLDWSQRPGGEGRHAGAGTRRTKELFSTRKNIFSFLAPALTIDVDISYVFIMECLHEKSVMSRGLGCLLYCVWTGGWCSHRMLLCVSSILLSPHQAAGLGWAGLGWAGLGWAGLGCGRVTLKPTLQPSSSYRLDPESSCSLDTRHRGSVGDDGRQCLRVTLRRCSVSSPDPGY